VTQFAIRLEIGNGYRKTYSVTTESAREAWEKADNYARRDGAKIVSVTKRNMERA